MFVVVRKIFATPIWDKKQTVAFLLRTIILHRNISTARFFLLANEPVTLNLPSGLTFVHIEFVSFNVYWTQDEPWQREPIEPCRRLLLVGIIIFERSRYSQWSGCSTGGLVEWYDRETRGLEDEKSKRTMNKSWSPLGCTRIEGVVRLVPHTVVFRVPNRDFCSSCKVFSNRISSQSCLWCISVSYLSQTSNGRTVICTIKNGDSPPPPLCVWERNLSTCSDVLSKSRLQFKSNNRLFTSASTSLKSANKNDCGELKIN